MSEPISQDEINGIVWKACDTFRGAVDPSEYKNYILTMLFLKYLSDLWKDKKQEYEVKYKGDAERVKRALSRERFTLPDECDFDYLYSKRDAPNIGELINIALEKIEDANKSKLENVFRNIDFNSEPALGQTKERNRRLKHEKDEAYVRSETLRGVRRGFASVLAQGSVRPVRARRRAGPDPRGNPGHPTGRIYLERSPEHADRPESTKIDLSEFATGIVR